MTNKIVKKSMLHQNRLIYCLQNKSHLTVCCYGLFPLLLKTRQVAFEGITFGMPLVLEGNYFLDLQTTVKFLSLF